MKQTHYITLLVFIGLLLFTCKKQYSDNQNPTNKNRQFLHVALTGNPTTLDIQSTSATITAQVTRSIYDTLLAPDGKALLATSWTVSEDGTQWTFILKQNVLFHNGSLFTAKDVVATLNRMKHKDSNSPFKPELANFTQIIATDNHTVSITLHRPDSSMPLLLASSHMAILPAKLIAQTHNFSRVPVGTGPFVFESWKDGTSISLRKNSAYHIKEPAIEGVKFFIITDVNAQVQSIIRGDIDIIPYIIEPELSMLKSKKDISIIPFPGSTILLLAMNTRVDPIKKIEFRKAIAQSIDKKKVIDLAYPNSRITNMFWHSNSNFYVETPEIFDKKTATKYFAHNPISRTLTISVPLNFAPHVRAAQVYQTMLEEVGLSVTIEKIEWGTWLDKVYKKGNFDITVIGHTGKLSPGQRLNIFAESGGYVGWKNKKFTALINKAKTETNNQYQTELYQQALTLMTKEYPFIFIGENTVNFAMRNTIKNMIFDPVLETYDFTLLEIENK